MNLSINSSILKCGDVNLVGLGTLVIGRAINRYMNAGIAKSGLSINQIYLLYCVGECRGMTIGQMAKKTLMEKCTITLNLQSLKKYVASYKNLTDRRTVYPALTKKGADFLEKWMPTVLELEKNLGSLTANGDSLINFVNFFIEAEEELK